MESSSFRVSLARLVLYGAVFSTAVMRDWSWNRKKGHAMVSYKSWEKIVEQKEGKTHKEYLTDVTDMSTGDRAVR